MIAHRRNPIAVTTSLAKKVMDVSHTNNVLHPGVRTPANKAGGENNSEDENSALDDRNDDAGHEWSFQTEGFQYRTGFSRVLLARDLEVDSPQKSV